MATVADLREKLRTLRMELGLRTQAQLATALNIDPANVPQWLRAGSVPDNHVVTLVGMLGVPRIFFCTSNAQEFEDVVSRQERKAALWLQVLRRARLPLIELRAVPGVRGVVSETEYLQYWAPEEVYAVGDRVHVELRVPWDSFPMQERLHAYLFATDAEGTMTTHAPASPSVVGRHRSCIVIPDPQKSPPFALTPPRGEQSFTALFLKAALDDDVVTSFQAAASGRPGVIDYIDPVRLNTLATHLLRGLEAADWLVAHKPFVVGSAPFRSA